MTNAVIPALAPHLPSLREAAAREPLGLYLHIPFCKDRCTYCSFVTTRDQGLKASALARLEADLQVWGQALNHPEVDTLYLGGGTPSILTTEEITSLVRVAKDAFNFAPLMEATLEANPGTVDLAWMKAVRKLGFDRLSLGIQTLDDTLLSHLGRIHDGAGGINALLMAQEAGFHRVSADLMVGIPGQRLDRVVSDARTLIAAGATHLSVYMLDLDKNCPLKAQVDAGKLHLPSDDDVADVFEALQAELPKLGLEPYEISNYAIPGELSLHNTRYWERRPYLGLGPSAASHLDRWRWTESEVIQAWAEGRGKADVQELDAAADLAEIPLLGLRMHRGIDWEALQHHAALLDLRHLVDGWEVALKPFLQHGLLAREGPILRFTNRGMLLSNTVLETFI
ncbi:MAG: radical SAM family heme chaperone HemW [Holophaga sp.]